MPFVPAKQPEKSQHTKDSRKKARVSDDPDERGRKECSGIRVNAGGVCFVPAQNLRLSDWTVPSLSEKSSAFLNGELAEKIQQQTSRWASKATLDALYLSHGVPAGDLDPGLRGIFWEPIAMLCDRRRIDMFVNEEYYSSVGEQPRKYKIVAKGLTPRGGRTKDAVIGRGDWTVEVWTKIPESTQSRARIGELMFASENELKAKQLAIDRSGRFTFIFDNFADKMSGSVTAFHAMVIAHSPLALRRTHRRPICSTSADAYDPLP